MKKVFGSIFLLVTVITFTACGSNSKTKDSSSEISTSETKVSSTSSSTVKSTSSESITSEISTTESENPVIQSSVNQPTAETTQSNAPVQQEQPQTDSAGRPAILKQNDADGNGIADDSPYNSYGSLAEAQAAVQSETEKQNANQQQTQQTDQYDTNGNKLNPNYDPNGPQQIFEDHDAYKNEPYYTEDWKNTSSNNQ